MIKDGLKIIKQEEEIQRGTSLSKQPWIDLRLMLVIATPSRRTRAQSMSNLSTHLSLSPKPLLYSLTLKQTRVLANESLGAAGQHPHLLILEA